MGVRSKQTGKRHMDIILTALIDFHKSQCFFSGTIQITAFLYYQQDLGGNIQGSISGAVLVVLATTGLLPVNLTLGCVAAYGRLSWYLLILSSMTTVLSTVTLVLVIMSPLSDGGGGLEDFCGSTKLDGNYYGTILTAGNWLWVVWAVCVAQLSLCWYQKFPNRARYRQWLQKVRPIFRLWVWIASRIHARVWAGILVLVWAACFGAQFYLFSLYFQNSLISYEWSFGQIIAIAVWLPSLFEYVYILYGKCSRPIQHRFSPAPALSSKTANDENSWN